MPNKKKPIKSDKEFGTYNDPNGKEGGVTVYRKGGPYDSGIFDHIDLGGIDAKASADTIRWAKESKLRSDPNESAKTMRDSVKRDRERKFGETAKRKDGFFKSRSDGKKGESDSKPEKSKDAKFLKMITKNKKGS